jgi:hypothetical protein
VNLTDGELKEGIVQVAEEDYNVSLSDGQLSQLVKLCVLEGPERRGSPEEGGGGAGTR